jgi:hypothetical protein
MAYHASKSPSSSDRWGAYEDACTASIQAQEGLTSENSDASREGTCGHQLCAEVLMNPELDPQAYLDRKMLFWIHPESDCSGEDWAEMLGENLELGVEITGEVIVSQPLIDACVAHINFVREQRDLLGATMFCEEAVPIDHITGEQDATGSSDVVLITDDTCMVIDLKLGRMPVTAYEVVTPAHQDILTLEQVPERVEPNSQVAMYASGTLRKFELFGSFKHVVLIISQPFLNKVSQWSGTVAELNVTIERLRRRAKECDEAPVFSPTPSNCHFCKASGNCKAQDAAVLDALTDFDDVTQAKPKVVSDVQLGTKYALIPMLTDWIKAVETRTYAALQQGLPVMRSDGVGYKLVPGKKGNREWISEEEAIAALKKMRLKDEQIFISKLKSPTQIEPLGKPPKVKKGEPPIPPVLGPTQFNRVLKLITQSEGKPVIALSTDPRPAVAKATDGFEDVPPEDSNSDLF